LVIPPTRRRGIEGSPATARSGKRAFVSLAAGPPLRLGDELAELGEERARRGLAAVEGFDPVESREHSARFVHVSTVAARCGRFVTSLCRISLLFDAGAATGRRRI
jgi:hypothetical protein